MFKKMLIVSTLFLLIVSYSNTARAAIEITNPYGYYQISGGNMKVNVNFPKIITINVSVPNITILQSQLNACFVFDYWLGAYGADYGVFGIYSPADFSSIIPGLPIPSGDGAPTYVGQWEMTGPGKFSIVPIYQGGDGYYYILPDRSSLEQYINDLLATQGGIIGMIRVSIPKMSFTGSYNANMDTIKVTFSITISVNAVVTTGAITFNGSFTTSRGTFPLTAGAAGIFSAPSGNANTASKGLAEWVVDLIKILPLKDVAPDN